jgi:16S rRNA (cytidine1402-2'-O)-methyltransferase
MAAEGESRVGTLFICGTPIGNLEDVTIRLLKVLRGVSLIACEDTRRTLRLLNRYHIRKPLLSYHAFSKPQREEVILRRLADGGDVAYVSDAGMPLISDPGGELLQNALALGYPVTVVPGPSAGITALVASGLGAASFVFLGFPPERGARRASFFQHMGREERTQLLYEAPHRLNRTLEALETALGGDRPLAVARELTKRYEEVRRGTVGEMRAHYAAKMPKGEFCLVVGAPLKPARAPEISEEALKRELLELIARGQTKKAALKAKAAEYHIPKSRLYKMLLEEDD